MYLYVKSIHIIAMVSWFAGLFYLPRLLVYHTEAQTQEKTIRDVLSERFSRMEKLLYNAIMVPAMWVTLLTGFLMLYLNPLWLTQGWMHMKLVFVAVLLLYHFYTRKLVREAGAGHFRWTSLRLRLWNEVATIILVAVVFLVVLKNSLDWIWGVLGVILFAILIMGAVRLINRKK